MYSFLDGIGMFFFKNVYVFLEPFQDGGRYHIEISQSGFDGKITYNNQSEQASNENIEEANQTRKRKRAIIWYNSRYSMNVKTNIDKTFFKLLQKPFPPTHPMYTIFNKNKIKLATVASLIWGL